MTRFLIHEQTLELLQKIWLVMGLRPGLGLKPGPGAGAGAMSTASGLEKGRRREWVDISTRFPPIVCVHISTSSDESFVVIIGVKTYRSVGDLLHGIN